MPRATSVILCVLAAGCGRVGFAPYAGDASAADAPSDTPADAPASDASAGHLMFGAGSAAIAFGSASSVQASVDVEAGDLILVGTSFDTGSTAPAGVTLTDTFGDSYSTVSGPLNGTDTNGQGLHQSISASATGSAGAVTVTAAIASPSYSYVELEVVTYRGTATLPFGNALAQAQAQGSGAATTDPIATTSADALVVAYVVGLDGYITAGSGSTERAIVDGDLVQDTLVPAPGDVPLTFGFAAGGADAEWVLTAIVLN